MNADFGVNYGNGDFGSSPDFGQSIDLEQLLKTGAGAVGANLLTQFMQTGAGQQVQQQLVAQTEEKAVVTGWQKAKDHFKQNWKWYAIGGGAFVMLGGYTVYRAWFRK